MTYPRYVMTEMGLRREDSPIDGRYINGALALVYDREGGTLLKHGGEDKMQTWVAIFWALGAGTPLAGAVALLSFEQETLTQELLDEINRCVQVAGYIERFAEKLFATSHPSNAIVYARPADDLLEAFDAIEGCRVKDRHVAGLERELTGAECALTLAPEAIHDPVTSIDDVDALRADLQRREDRVRDLSNLLERARRMRAAS